MRLALAQLDAVVGDLAGNRSLIVDAIREAHSAGADLVLFPELVVTGYPPEDLLLRPGFVKAARASLDEIAAATEGITALVGCPVFERDLANACVILAGGALRGIYRKQFLPNYGVFDEHRYFAAGRDLTLLRFGEVLVGPDDLRGHLAAGPARDRPRCCRRPADRQSLGVALPRGQGRGPGGDAGHPCSRQRLVPRLLQPRRWAGRARLRRALRRSRRRRRGDRTRTGLRGGAARRRPRPDRGDRAQAARRAPPRARAFPRDGASAGGDRSDGDRHPGSPRQWFGSEADGCPLRHRARADAAGTRPRRARLRGEERLPRGRDRRLRRHRLGPRPQRSAPTRSAQIVSTPCRCRRATRRQGRATMPAS